MDRHERERRQAVQDLRPILTAAAKASRSKSTKSQEKYRALLEEACNYVNGNLNYVSIIRGYFGEWDPDKHELTDSDLAENILLALDLDP